MEEVNHLYAFEKLKIWDEIRKLIELIYLRTKGFPDDEKYGLVSQIRRAAFSVGSSSGKGTGRTSSKDQAHFYQLSYSSLMEVLSQLIVSKNLSYLNEEEHKETRIKIQSVSLLLNQLRKSTLAKPAQTNKPTQHIDK
ncbi:MAG: four helix bundle protein [Ignavibacteriaceae bacterium]